MEKVLHVIAHLDIGGAQSSLYHLWPALAVSKEYKIEFCVLNYLGHYGRLLQSEGAVVHNFGIKERISGRMISQLSQLISGNDYKILHAHLFPELYLVPMSTNRSNKKISLIYTEHSANNRRRQFFFPFRFIDWLAYSNYEKIIAVGSTTCENLKTWQPSLSTNIVRIPNSVRLTTNEKTCDARQKILSELKIPQDSNKLLLLFAGRLAYPKGCDLLIEALASQNLPDYLCLIAGDGPEKQSLHQLVQSRGMENKISFLGFRSDICELLTGVDAVVIPSRWEGLPMIVLEAMAAHCAIVATAVDGTKELVDDDVSALLVPPEDPKLLGLAIKKMLLCPDLRQKLIDGSSAIVKEYSPDAVANRLFALYDQVLNS